MKAIILNAGQGRRLLPLTRDIPKCLLPVDGERSMLDFQLDALETTSVREVVVMLGFGAERVERHLAARAPGRLRVHTQRNPDYVRSDNLITCWRAAPHMDGPFLLLNGDTLFEPAVVQRTIAAPAADATMVVDRKPSYDDDDMKVSLAADGRLRAVGKQIAPPAIDGEAIGLMRFQERGIDAFRDALTRAVEANGAERRWYLSAVDALASRLRVSTVSVHGLWWTEVDSPEDLRALRVELEAGDERSRARVAAPLRARSSLFNPL